MSRLSRLIGLSVACVVLAVPVQAGEDFDQFVREQQKAFSKFVEDDQEAFQQFVEDVRQKWNEFLDSSKKEWVAYSECLNARSRVNFEEGTIEVEALAEVDREEAAKECRGCLAEQVVAVLTEENHTSGERMLAGQVRMPDSDALVTPENVSECAARVCGQATVEPERISSKDGRQRMKMKAILRMVPNHVRVRAEHYTPTATSYAAQNDLDAAMVSSP
jgi:hypothetical protein